MSEAAIGFGGVFIGWLLTVIWDQIKTHRSDKRHISVILNTILQECIDNLRICSLDLEVLQRENNLPQNDMTLLSLLPLKTFCLELIRGQLPDKLVSDQQLTERLSNFQIKSLRINHCIFSRQTFKDTSLALSNAATNLRIRNDILISHINEIRTDIGNLIEVIQSHQKSV